MILNFSGLTDTGLQRYRNEDAFLILPLNGRSEEIKKISSDVSPYLILVADGLGGHAGGDTASEIICKVFRSYVNQRSLLTSDSVFTEENAFSFLRTATEDAHKNILKTAQQNPALKGMGAVCTSGIFLSDSLVIAHTGDTRCYILRKNTLIGVTEDHTHIASLLRSGKLTEAEAVKHPLRHVVTDALGYGSSPRIDIKSVSLQAGDRVLFCSDGLTEMLTNDDIKSIMNFYKDTKSCNQALIDGALRSGGTDNITAVIADIS